MSRRASFRHLHRGSRQLELFSGAPIEPASRNEPLEVYDCVRELRLDCHRVYRAGPGKHLVDGRILSTRALRDLPTVRWIRAAAERSKGEQNGFRDNRESLRG
jgi:hypothetical protein